MAEGLGSAWKRTSLRWSSVSLGVRSYNQVVPTELPGARGRTTAGLQEGMPARCRRSQGGRGVMGIPEGVRGDGVIWVGLEEYVASLELGLF